MVKSKNNDNTKSGAKGFKTEELIRKYFIQSGFYVCRGLKLAYDGDDITDIDIWIYERSATLARRRTIIDVKDKQRPQASERLLFVLGLARMVGTEGCGVVTTDNRQSLRELAIKHKVLWINGNDLKRLKSSRSLLEMNRLSEEDLVTQLAALDRARGSKNIQDLYESGKSSLADRFGIQSANFCLDATLMAADWAVRSHPNSPQAGTLVRMTYSLASMCAASFDYASAETALRPAEERVQHLTKAIRFGSDEKVFEDRLSWLEKVVTHYADSGATTARKVLDGLKGSIKGENAEALAQVLVKLSHDHRLFDAARKLDAAAFSEKLTSLKSLDAGAVTVLGAILDHGEIERRTFVNAWTGNET